jgi:hypothetical protein
MFRHYVARRAHVIEDHAHNAAVRYIGTAECLPVGFLNDEIADPRSLATRRDVATLAVSTL